VQARMVGKKNGNVETHVTSFDRNEGFGVKGMRLCVKYQAMPLVLIVVVINCLAHPFFLDTNGLPVAINRRSVWIA